MEMKMRRASVSGSAFIALAFWGCSTGPEQPAERTASAVQATELGEESGEEFAVSAPDAAIVPAEREEDGSGQIVEGIVREATPVEPEEEAAEPEVDWDAAREAYLSYAVLSCGNAEITGVFHVDALDYIPYEGDELTRATLSTVQIVKDRPRVVEGTVAIEYYPNDEALNLQLGETYLLVMNRGAAPRRFVGEQRRVVNGVLVPGPGVPVEAALTRLTADCR